jgi:hypothetical protein
MDWVFTKLDEWFNLDQEDVISLNRKDCNWSQTEEEANILWGMLFKFALLVRQ